MDNIESVDNVDNVDNLNDDKYQVVMLVRYEVNKRNKDGMMVNHIKTGKELFTFFDDSLEDCQARIDKLLVDIGENKDA